MSTAGPDVTAVLNLHREGPLAHSSVRSVLDAKSLAEQAGLRIELIVALDRPDRRTASYVASLAAGRETRILDLDLGDLAEARNAAIGAAAGRFVAFLDGDDLWSDDWLVLAHRQAVREGTQSVLHPEINVFFGDGFEPYWLKHFGDRSTQGHWTNLALGNLWTSLSFADRRLYQAVPYRRNAIAEGFGYEDWAWNADIIDRGFQHEVVTGAVHFVRMRHRSLVKLTSAADALMTPTRLFRNRVGQGRGDAVHPLPRHGGVRARG